MITVSRTGNVDRTCYTSLKLRGGVTYTVGTDRIIDEVSPMSVYVEYRLMFPSCQDDLQVHTHNGEFQRSRRWGEFPNLTATAL